jgi:outer membrane protein
LGSTAAVGATTLEEAFAIAYDTNPDLITSRAQLREIDEQVNIARSGLRPRADVNLRYGLEYQERQGQDIGRDDPFSASIDATQPLYDGGQTFNSVRGRIADVSAARARLTQLEQQVMFDVVTAFFDILRDEQVVSLAQNNVRVITEQLRASQDRFEVGEVTRTDVSQAQARLAAAEANLSTQRGVLERSRQFFRSVVGQEAGGLQPPRRLPALPASLEEAVTLALENHPAVIATRFDEVSARRDIRAQIGALLPQVSLDGSVGFDDDAVLAGDSVDTNSAFVALRARIPLYQGGAEYARVRAAQARASAARSGISSEARERQRIAEAAWTELAVARASIRSTEQQVAAAQLAFEGVREEAIVGSRTTLDVLDAEQELLDARTELVSAQRDQSVAAYGLLAAVGQLTTAALDVPVEPYDPEVNYELNNRRFFGFEQTDDTRWEALWRP